jgi:uncharacterized membrane protein YoaK (UPF0700 family)
MATEPTGRMFASLALLTFLTGLVDAASVLGLGHIFTANMTGNVVFLGFRLAGEGDLSIVASMCALGAFLVGAMIGGRAARHPGRFRVVIGVEAALLLLATLVAITQGYGGATRNILIALLAGAMGLQNAAVRRLGVADMTTTVLTLTLTGLAADSRLAAGEAPRVGRRVTSVLLMLSGAFCGAWLLSRGPAWPLMGTVVVVILAWVSAPEQRSLTPLDATTR